MNINLVLKRASSISDGFSPIQQSETHGLGRFTTQQFRRYTTIPNSTHRPLLGNGGTPKGTGESIPRHLVGRNNILVLLWSLRMQRRGFLNISSRSLARSGFHSSNIDHSLFFILQAKKLFSLSFSSPYGTFHSQNSRLCIIHISSD